MDTLRMMLGQDNVEVYSVDEAFLDFSQIPAERLYEKATEVRATVEGWTGIKVSVGVAPTKVLCKLANRLAKKKKEETQCVTVLDTEEKIRVALKQTPVRELWGVGRKYASRLAEQWGIADAWQLRNMPETWAQKNMGGVVGVRMVRELRGEPCISMRDPLDKKKMIATTRMFGQPVREFAAVREAVATYTSRAAEKLRRQRSAAGSLTVFMIRNDHPPGDYRYNPKTIDGHIVLPRATSATAELIRHALPIAEQLFSEGSSYIKAGIILGSLVPDGVLQENFFEGQAKPRQQALMQVLDNINFSMREDMLKYVSTGMERNWKMRQEARSPKYTSRWEELPEVH